MFLRPHHLQRSELYNETMRNCGLRALEPQSWGLLHLELAEEPLANFTLSVTRLRAVFEDGSLVDVPGNSRLASASFEARMKEVGRPLDVKVGVRRREDGVPQTRPEAEGAGRARFCPHEEEVFDVDAGQDQVPIEFLKYNLRFFFGDEPTDGYEVLPLTRLVRTGDAARPVGVAPGFVPPALVVAASPNLHEMARGAVETASTGLRGLGHARGGQNPEPLILFQALAGALPVLRDMVQDGQVHPRHVYRELARLAGCLFFRDPARGFPDQVPAYDHREPGPVFEELARLIAELSQAIHKERWKRLPMHKEGDQFLTALPEESGGAGVQFFLEIEVTQTAPGDVRALLEGAKMSSPERMSTLRTFALPGVATEQLAGPPPQLPPGQTGLYRRLKIESGEEWAKFALPGGKLAVLILNAPEDLKLNLIMVFPEG